MSTKTHIGRQEEASTETGVELRTSAPISPIDTQTWVDKTYSTFVTNTSSSNATLRKFDGVIQLPALNLDANWGKAYKIISADSTFTFSNFADGVKVEMTVINSDLYNSHTISFPSLKFTNISSTNLILNPSETAIYTFTQTNSVIYCSVVKGVYPLNQTWMWGAGNFGQLGNNNNSSQISPVLVVGNHSFVNVYIGSDNYQALGLKVDGSAWSWGYNKYGQLGINTDTNNRSSPVLVVGSHSFVNMACGTHFSHGLKDGSCWAFGNNGNGQLGSGDTISSSSPVLVVGGHSFISIVSSDAHTTALKLDGSCWAWGQNFSTFGNVLGDNTAISRSSPSLVVGSHSFISIAAGDYHNLALKVDGSIWAWGVQYTSLIPLTSGAVGDNSTTIRNSPVAVVGSHSFIKIAAGERASYGLKSDGSAWSWGYNLDGELGHNDTNYRSSPVLLVGSHSFINIANLVGLKNDGTVWNWGYNISRSSPIQVIGNFSFTKIFGIGGQIINPNNF